ncbi:MAG: Ig-like domain-containing protein [Candidatus Promineifilaceae bacterium]|nr:Ig-like domain-containing protein [Candidatus Promineifilaceae bacterium]
MIVSAEPSRCDIFSVTIPAQNVIPPSLSYYIEAVDSGGKSTTKPHLVSVISSNQAPVAGDDSYTVGANSVLAVSAPGVLANDADDDGDPLTAILTSDVSNGNLTLIADGSFTYTPTIDYSGDDFFSYKAYDGKDYSYTATVAITVTRQEPPAIPTLYSPSETITDTTPTYTWEDGGDAAQYYLYVRGADGLKAYDFWYDASAVCTAGICQATLATELAYGDYKWWVKARNGFGDSGWGTGYVFTVSAP